MVAQTYKRFSENFDRAQVALTSGLGLQFAIDHGYLKPQHPAHGVYIPEQDPLNLAFKPRWHKPQPHPSFVNLFDIFRFGDQFGRQFDPGHLGWHLGRPNQGYGNWAAKPRIIVPDWPRLTPDEFRFKSF